MQETLENNERLF